MFLKKSDPMSSLGEEVTHLDEIVLEQEFAYLTSQDPVRNNDSRATPISYLERSYSQKRWACVRREGDVALTAVDLLLLLGAQEGVELRQVPSFPVFSFDGSKGRDKLARQLEELMDCNNYHSHEASNNHNNNNKCGPALDDRRW